MGERNGKSILHTSVLTARDNSGEQVSLGNMAKKFNCIIICLQNLTNAAGRSFDEKMKIQAGAANKEMARLRDELEGEKMTSARERELKEEANARAQKRAIRYMTHLDLSAGFARWVQQAQAQLQVRRSPIS